MIKDFDFTAYNLIKSTVGDLVSERALLRAQLGTFIDSKANSEEYHICAKEAQAILNAEALATQSEIENHLSSVVTMALSAVEVDDPAVPKPPEFVVRFVERRDSTECDLLFKEGDREDYPKDSSGCGYQDIADYALRVDFILLEEEYGEEGIRKTLILDEPFKNADQKLQHKISEMLLMVSDELGFQQLIVSHGDGINIKANKTFHVKKIDGISKIIVNP